MDIEEIKRTSVISLKFVLKLIENKNNVDFAVGTSEGAVVPQLSKKGIIEPFGRVHWKIKWRLAKHFSDEKINLIRQIIKINAAE